MACAEYEVAALAFRRTDVADARSSFEFCWASLAIGHSLVGVEA
jgi:hypothetical protein